MCLELYTEHGTTMAGLKALGFEFDNDDFHAYVHGKLPHEKLKPDPVLKNLLLSMPQRKIIFTNADKRKFFVGWVWKTVWKGLFALKHLIHHFHQLLMMKKWIALKITTEILNDSGSHGFYSECESEIDTDTNGGQNATSAKLHILCKPSVEAMKSAIKIANIDPKKTIFFDDSSRNIAAVKAAGLNTVIVGSSVLVPGADFALNNIHNIKEALPEIWEDEDQSEPVLQSVAVESN